MKDNWRNICRSCRCLIRQLLCIAIIAGLIFLPGCGSGDSDAEFQHWLTYRILISDAAAADDNPWGTTAGIISLEDGESCLLLTPDTSAEFFFLSDKTLDLSVEIHPWISELSDGADLIVWIMDDAETILHQYDHFVSAADGRQPLHIDLSPFDKASRVRLSCGNGGGSNDGDWVIIGQGESAGDVSPSRIPWEELFVTFDNVQAAGDNPWNCNAGVVDSGTDGSCVFLTPDTAAYVYVNGEEGLSFDLKLHPWVAESSDGVGVLISLLDDSGAVLYKETITLDSTGSFVFDVDTDAYPRCSCVSFRCSSGEKNNGNADWLLIGRRYHQDSTFTRFGYVRSATYYGKEWPINFWNSEMDELDADMLQIKNDGFDSIIICIPWKEFQTDTGPVAYSDYAFDQLDRVMAAAQRAELGVYTRISYTWDYWNDTEEYIFDRFTALLSSLAVRDAWMDYAGRLYSRLNVYDVFRGAFLTWEDFWGILNVCDIEDEAVRIGYANDMGYREWVKEHYTLREYNERFGKAFENYDLIPIPGRQEPAMESMYSFFDEFLNSFLRQAQEVFPDLSNEVRLDADLVYDLDREPQYYSHQSTYGCENADFTAAMYGIPMGYENMGEQTDAEEAIKHTRYILNNLLSQNKGKPVYVEQFIFYDNTPKFAQNARLIEEEIDDYLKLAADVLLQYTAGYGVWTYRDYRNNMLFNNGFFLSERGWDLIGNVSFEEVDGSMSAHLEAGDGLSQQIADIRDHFPSDEYTVSFDVVRCAAPGVLRISFGDHEETADIRGTGRYSLSFPKNSSFDLSVIAESGNCSIDDICLYSFTQSGRLYSADNGELEFVDCIRALNESLKRGK